MARTGERLRARRVAFLVVLTLAGVPPWTTAGQPATGMVSCASSTAASCQERRYRLAARVRPLLFWIAKDDVGEARLTRQVLEEGGRGYALLIGSDPARAPRKINRWGYISEIQDRGAVHVFGFMTQADEESLEQAKAATGSVPDGSQVYKVIHSTIAEDRATSAVQGVAFPKTVTLHDLDAVVAQLPTPPSGAGVQLPPRTEAGFLFAMSSLLHENVEAVHRAGTAEAGSRRSYVYNKKLYTVVTNSSRLLKRVAIKGHEYRDVIESEFEARAVTTGSSGTYRVVYGTQGTLREVPIRIVYRPSFWFEAELFLTD